MRNKGMCAKLREREREGEGERGAAAFAFCSRNEAKEVEAALGLHCPTEASHRD